MLRIRFTKIIFANFGLAIIQKCIYFVRYCGKVKLLICNMFFLQQGVANLNDHSLSYFKWHEMAHNYCILAIDGFYSELFNLIWLIIFQQIKLSKLFHHHGFNSHLYKPITFLVLVSIFNYQAKPWSLTINWVYKQLYSCYYYPVFHT